MKNSLIIMLMLMLSAQLFAQEAEDVEIDPALKKQMAVVEAEFEKIVGGFAAFFQAKQKLVYAFKNKRGSDDIAAYVIEYTCKEVHYAVSSTGDARLPFLAAITLTLTRKTNRSCGNVAGATMLGLPAGWNTVEAAVENAGKSTCFKSNVKASGNKVRINFEYLDGVWKYKSSVNETRKAAELPLESVFGNPIEPGVAIDSPAATELNSRWKALLGMR